MWPIRIAAILATLALAAPVAAAQDNATKCNDADTAARSAPLDGLTPFAGISDKPGFVRVIDGPNCQIVTFYRLPANPSKAHAPADIRKVRQEYGGEVATPFFAARYVDDTGTPAYNARWTDQHRCPALVSALERLEPILAPKITGNGPQRYASMGTSDRPIIDFWMTGQVYPQTDPDFTLNYSLSGGSETAFGKWLNETTKALKPCWSDEAPKLP